jgi:membrane associated rhomboid family serine protease
VFALFTSMPNKVRRGQVWRLITSGLLTFPQGPGLSHLAFTLLGLYFLTPELESRWGSPRFARFLFLSVVCGNLLAIALDKVAPPNSAIFHTHAMFGASAAIVATAVAWSRDNAEREVRLMFFLPVKGKWLFWVTLGWCALSVVYGDAPTEGLIAPFGGFLVGLLLGGSPSPLRALYLQTKLLLLKRQGGGRAAQGGPRPIRRPRPGAPPLRVVQGGGIEDELKKREPPKDKRYLN